MHLILLRKTYNFLYKYFLFIFNIDWFSIFFRKNSIVSIPSNGILIRNILKDENAVESILKELENKRFLSIGFIDEKGNIITPYNLRLNQPVKTKTQEKRKKFIIEIIVLPNKVVALKKIHNNILIFFREIYAMTLLRGNGLYIPRIYDYNLKSKEILMEYIDGINLKNLLALKGADKDLENLYNDPLYINSSSLKKFYARTRMEKEYLNCALSNEQLAKIKEDIKIVFSNRMIYQDVKFGNIMIYNKKVFWIDFEHCKKHNFISQSFFMRLYKPYDKKFQKHFEMGKLDFSQLTGESQN